MNWPLPRECYSLKGECHFLQIVRNGYSIPGVTSSIAITSHVFSRDNENIFTTTSRLLPPTTTISPPPPPVPLLESLYSWPYQFDKKKDDFIAFLSTHQTKMM